MCNEHRNPVFMNDCFHKTPVQGSGKARPAVSTAYKHAVVQFIAPFFKEFFPA